MHHVLLLKTIKLSLKVLLLLLLTRHRAWWLHDSENSTYAMCSLPTCYHTIIEIDIISPCTFVYLSNKILPYHAISNANRSSKHLTSDNTPSLSTSHPSSPPPPSPSHKYTSCKSSRHNAYNFESPLPCNKYAN